MASWTDLAIAHPLQNDDVSCGVYVLKVILMNGRFVFLKLELKITMDG